MKKRLLSILLLLAVSVSFLTGCELLDMIGISFGEQYENISLDEIPEFDGENAYVVINKNVPFFDGERTDSSYESYSELDSLGRCGVAISCIGADLMPTEDRGSIGQIKPSGWQTVKYDVVDGKYLYNRCHLIGFQLTGENANEKNLITGTRYMNVIGMLPFENMVADFIKETNMHVLYRVTPIFDGANLVASGVLMEARSVEDGGEGIEFCVYVYNVQPYITINYKNGESALSTDKMPEDNDDEKVDTGTDEGAKNENTYVLNTSSKKYHRDSCSWAVKIAEENRDTFTGDIEELEKQGYEPCGTCKP